MELKVLSLADCEQVRLWRNEQLEILRTSFPLTEEMQKEFYHRTVCDRNSNARFWAIVEDGNEIWNKSIYGNSVPSQNSKLIGMCGLENISLENRSAEISIILTPAKWDGFKEVLLLILKKGFNDLNLENIYTEAYACNPIVEEWVLLHGEITQKKQFPILPARKFLNGRYYDSVYLNFNRTEFETYENTSA